MICIYYDIDIIYGYSWYENRIRYEFWIRSCRFGENCFWCPFFANEYPILTGNERLNTTNGLAKAIINASVRRLTPFSSCNQRFNVIRFDSDFSDFCIIWFLWSDHDIFDMVWSDYMIWHVLNCYLSMVDGYGLWPIGWWFWFINTTCMSLWSCNY